MGQKLKHALWIAVAVVGGVLMLMIVNQIPRAEAALTPSASSSLAVEYEDLIDALSRAGVVPEHLAAAGVTGSQAEQVLIDTAVLLLGIQDDIEQSTATYVSTKVECDALRRKIQAGLSSDDEVEVYNGLVSDLADAEAAREALHEQVFASASANLNDLQSGTLGAIRANAHWKLPVQYLVVNRTEPEWVALREALTNLRISEENDQEPDPEALQLVLDANTDMNVAQAAVNLEALLLQVQAAFDAPQG